MNPAGGDVPLDEQQRRLESRLDRERRARKEAEQLLESKSLELYEANRALMALAATLEQRVEERTRELSEARQRALQQAEIDALTGVANRAGFASHLGRVLGDTRATGQGVALLLIDLDDFKTVNDTLGHVAGDTLLAEFARRLTGSVRPGDLVARLGGDEFAVIAPDTGDRQDALLMAHRLLRELCRPVTVGDRSLLTSCSIGLAQAPPQGCRPDELLRDADLALYASKRAGRTRVTAFEVVLRDEIEQRAALEGAVRQAIRDDMIEPWFQPIVRPDTGSIIGAEVLARWRRADGEIRSPAAFLSTVESLGLLDQMMESMLRRALRDALPWITAGGLEYLSINVSPSQFNQGWTSTALPALMAESGVAPRTLLVEITETALLQDIERTRGILEALTASGMRIGLDDFGVGYSNFALLRQLPFDVLKLDRTLSFDIEADGRARALTECILDLATRLGIKVVAEGVETRRQADILASAGCTAMQGFWFARPHRELAVWFTDGSAQPQRRIAGLSSE